MNEEVLAELFVSIQRAIMLNPCSYMPYRALAVYYRNKGNSYQEYLCLKQALLYCDNETDRDSLLKEVYSLEENGIKVPRTAVIILSWNLIDYTKQCIESVRKTTLPEDVQIIVVDNGSTDGSAEWLQEQKDLTVRLNETNDGFPAGCNEGIELADEEADIYLLNNDTVLPYNALFWLKMGLYENERIGATGSLTNFAGNGQMINERFEDPGQVLEYAATHNIPLSYPYETKIWLVGFSMLIRRTVLDEVGVLDERFSPGNSEDVDISLRIRAAGYENIVCRNSVILHFGSKSFGKLGQEFEEIGNRNIEKLNDKYGIDLRYYLHPRTEIVKHIDVDQETPIRVLEWGCGAGATLAYIRTHYPNSSVYGVEIVPMPAGVAASMGEVVCDNLETMEFEYEEEFFDYCIMGDVLEHLHNPQNELTKLRPYVKTG